LERGGKEALDATARDQASLMLLVALPAAAGLALVSAPLAELMVGDGLAAAAGRVTPWIAAGGLFAGITTHYLNTAFTLARRTKLLFAVIALPAAANLVLALVLIPRFGLDGAMWATTGSFVFGSVVSWALARGDIALPIPWDAVLRCGLATAIMALVVLQVPAFGGLLELALKASVGAVIYALAAFALDAGGVRGQAQRLLVRRQEAAA
jgi:O-antigen/teichoic acid export membrane protein